MRTISEFKKEIEDIIDQTFIPKLVCMEEDLTKKESIIINDFSEGKMEALKVRIIAREKNDSGFRKFEFKFIGTNKITISHKVASEVLEKVSNFSPSSKINEKISVKLYEFKNNCWLYSPGSKVCVNIEIGDKDFYNNPCIILAGQYSPNLKNFKKIIYNLKTLQMKNVFKII